MAWVGVLMLDTRFPRPVGDIGNRETFARLGIPVRYQVIKGASPERVVRQGDERLLPDFVAAAQHMVAQGATLITTSCGFLVQYQAEIQASVGVPVLSSSLLCLQHLQSPAGVLTIDANALTPKHFVAAGAAPDTAVVGVETGCEFQRRILDDAPTLDLDQARRDVVQAAIGLTKTFPQTRIIVLECSNMAPYAGDVALATGRQVEHIMSLIEKQWKH
jgi:hypothetical protein